jgi:molybdopterin synthase catalytic subunit
MIARIITRGEETITMNQLLEQLKQSSHLDECGALFSFEGIVRGKDSLKTTSKITMTTPDRDKTEKELQRILEEVKDKHGVMDMGVVHYLGQFQPGDSLFLAAVSGAHRHETLDALHEIIERVKYELNFKKEEESSTGKDIIMSGG